MSDADRAAGADAPPDDAVQVGTAAFALAFALLLVLRFAAPDWTAGHSAWMWIALAGAVLGGIGLVIVGRHRRLGRTR